MLPVAFGWHFLTDFFYIAELYQLLIRRVGRVSIDCSATWESALTLQLPLAWFVFRFIGEASVQYCLASLLAHPPPV